jgi:sucrose-6-phosphate hydrolase SacC (GH32 family)
MDFAIPISHFDPKKVKLDQIKSCPLRKTISFAYQEENIQFTNLSLVLHPLRVIELDMEKKHLILEESNSSLLSKLEQLQSNINTELEKNPRRWLEQSKIPSILKNPLQQWIKSKQFALYLSSDPSSLSIFTDEGKVTFTEDILQPGDMVRVIIKIHGLSLQMSEEDIWTGKSRIQHHILQLYKLTS